MRKQLGSTLAAALVLPWIATAVNAQPSSAQVPTNPVTVTVRGCVERADQILTRGNTADVDSLEFMLIRVQAVTGSNGGAATPTGTSGTAASAASTVPGKPPDAGIGTSYRLRGQTNQINPHAGHEVEVTGTVTPAVAPPASTTGGTSTTAPVSGAQVDRAPVLTVSSLKLVSETCPRAPR